MSRKLYYIAFRESERGEKRQSHGVKFKERLIWDHFAADDPIRVDDTLNNGGRVTPHHRDAG